MNIVKKSQSFADPRKHNHSATAPIANNYFSGQVTLESYPQQCQQNNTTHMPHPKLPKHVKEPLFFKLWKSCHIIIL